MIPAPCIGVAKSGGGVALPDPPWVTIPNTRFAFLAANAVDSSGDITSQPDESGGGTFTPDVAEPDMVRKISGGRYGPEGAIAAGGVSLRRIADTTMRNAVATGDHSFILRCRLGEDGSIGIRQVSSLGVFSAPGATPRYGRLYCSSSNVQYQRRNSATTRTWNFGGFFQPDDADFTIGVSVAIGASTVASFFKDGVLIGTDTDTTLNWTSTVGTYHDTIGRNDPAVETIGEFVGGMMIAGTTSEAQQLEAHNYFQLFT